MNEMRGHRLRRGHYSHLKKKQHTVKEPNKHPMMKSMTIKHGKIAFHLPKAALPKHIIGYTMPSTWPRRHRRINLNPYV